MTQLLANLVAFIHIGYFLFIVVGAVAIVVGPRLGWRWIRHLPFRILHVAAVYVVLFEETFGIPCPLSMMQWTLRTAGGGPPEATEGVGGVLDGLLFRTIPGWALDGMYWSLGVGLLLLLYLVPPASWRRYAS
jgi:hypothetical protein